MSFTGSSVRLPSSVISASNEIIFAIRLGGFSSSMVPGLPTSVMMKHMKAKIYQPIQK